MKVCAVVSEFNPFHNGHKYLLSQLRANGFDAVLCVMSGNFVQRGEPSVADKKIRASMAVEFGADLVLSLPFPWSCASAEYFARGAVSVIGSLGCVDAIGFGSECADLSLLRECTRFLTHIDKNDIINIQKQDPRLSFAMARSKLAADKLGEKAFDVFSNPNDILAIEYMKAISLFGFPFEVYPVKRESASHDGKVSSSVMCSSSVIRKQISENNLSDIREYVPWDTDAHIGSFRSINKSSYFSFLRGAILSRSPEELAQFAEIGGGFEYAIYREMLVCRDYDSLLTSLGSRHLTDAKIRRALLFASLGVNKESLTSLPLFTEVLACNDIGKELLAKCRKSSGITVLSKIANIKKASEEAKEQFKLQRKAEIAFETLFDNN
ncbi:MAG: nucleotidyltransferase family protein [Ruminococcaceae bacterium]|nr:nucleotidyltransferase family protein [Oscillospiraceae bacterium]